MKIKMTVAALVVGLCLSVSLALADSKWLKGTADEKLEKLAEIAPGLGTIMMEYSARYTNVYYAATGGNWDLALYQLKEAREIQEVGEYTRPARADALKGFEQQFLDPLEKTIKAKDLKAFKKAFANGIEGCNGCHAGQGFPYIKYVLPKTPMAPLSWKKQ